MLVTLFLFPFLQICNTRHLSTTNGNIFGSNNDLKLHYKQQQQQIRYGSFRSSDLISDLKDYPNVTVEKNPPEWKYVEDLLAPPLIPKPVVQSEYPSGWKPPSADVKHLPYFVPRTKNYMIPVYLHLTYRGQRRITKLRNIHGDIWQLEKELHAVIQKKIGKNIATRINEQNGQIWFKGDFSNIIKDYLMEKQL